MANPKRELKKLKKEYKDLVNHMTAVIGRASNERMAELQTNIEKLDGKIKQREKEFGILLDLSTAHVSDATRKFLDEDSELNEYGQIKGIPARMVRHEYGWLLWPASKHHPNRWKNAPELKAINDFAENTGCIVVNFDRDANTNDRFPTYEW